ncbi:hypothetical protein [Eubacterium sp.]
MTIRFNKIDIWKILFLYLIFQPSISENIGKSPLAPIITYSDEVIAVIITIAVLFKLLQNKAKLLKFEQGMLIGLIMFEFFGIFSGIHYNYQETQYMLIDAFTCIKFFIYYLGTRVLTQDKLSKDYLVSLNSICKILAVVLFAFSIHDAFFTPWFPVGDYRYFTNSVILWFWHPESLSKASITIIFILAYNYKKYKNNIYYIFLLTVVMILTFRTKAIVSVVILYIFYLYFIKFNFKSLIPVGIATVAGASYFGYDSLNFYYVEIEDSARNILTRDSLTLSKQFFPLGTGFGTYGSSMAAQHYSKLYYTLGYNRIYKMNEYDTAYLSDTFWPIVIAQTGWLGLISFFFALSNMIVYIIKSRKSDIYYFWVAMSIIIYDLISSFATSAFFHPSSMAPYLLLGLLTSIHESPKKQ